MNHAIFYNDENGGNHEYRGGVSFLSSSSSSLLNNENREKWVGGNDSYQKWVVPFVLSHKKNMKHKWIDPDNDNDTDIPVIDNATFDKLFHSSAFEINSHGKRKTMKNYEKSKIKR